MDEVNVNLACFCMNSTGGTSLAPPQGTVFGSPTDGHQAALSVLQEQHWGLLSFIDYCLKTSFLLIN